jgi:hypothetical protein
VLENLEVEQSATMADENRGDMLDSEESPFFLLGVELDNQDSGCLDCAIGPKKGSASHPAVESGGAPCNNGECGVICINCSGQSTNSAVFRIRSYSDLVAIGSGRFTTNRSAESADCDVASFCAGTSVHCGDFTRCAVVGHEHTLNHTATTANGAADALFAASGLAGHDKYFARNWIHDWVVPGYQNNSRYGSAFLWSAWPGSTLSLFLYQNTVTGTEVVWESVGTVDGNTVLNVTSAGTVANELVGTDDGQHIGQRMLWFATNGSLAALGRYSWDTNLVFWESSNNGRVWDSGSGPSFTTFGAWADDSTGFPVGPGWEGGGTNTGEVDVTGDSQWVSSVCSASTGTPCRIDADCPASTCSATTAILCHRDTQCPSGETCTGGGTPGEACVLAEGAEPSCHPDEECWGAYTSEYVVPLVPCIPAWDVRMDEAICSLRLNGTGSQNAGAR